MGSKLGMEEKQISQKMRQANQSQGKPNHVDHRRAMFRKLSDALESIMQILI